MKQAWGWIKSKVVWLGSSLGVLLLVLLGAGWLWNKRQGRVPSVAQIRAAEHRLERLNEIQAEIRGRVGEKDIALDQLDLEKVGLQRTMVAAQKDVEALSDAEVVAEFGRLYPPS